VYHATSSLESVMPLTVEAVYENGVLKPVQPLPLQEQERVQVTVQRPADVQAALDAVRRGFGLLRWTGDVETLRRVAEDDEFCILESP
jgi:predicted DNA-binding antitoxin AbrB/MazE fold protein